MKEADSIIALVEEGYSCKRNNSRFGYVVECEKCHENAFLSDKQIADEGLEKIPYYFYVHECGARRKITIDVAYDKKKLRDVSRPKYTKPPLDKLSIIDIHVDRITGNTIGIAKAKKCELGEVVWNWRDKVWQFINTGNALKGKIGEETKRKR